MYKDIAIAGLVVSAVAAIVDVGIFFAAKAAGVAVKVPVPFMDSDEMPWFVIAIAAALAGKAAAALALVLRRIDARTATMRLTWIVALVAPLSCVPLLILGGGWQQTLTLVAIHLATGAIALAFLLRPLRTAQAASV